jgi:hypothetical protein
LVTTASGFAVSILDLPRASPTPVVIRLQREGAISGVVVDTTGAPAGADVFVLAIPAGSPLNDGEVALRALRGDRRQRLTATDHDGRFRLDQLEPSIKYSLACGGSGRLQMRPVQGIRPNQGDVEIVAGWGYGEIICLVDDHGDPLSDELIHSPSRKFEVGCLDSSILPVHSGSATSLLACPEIEFANGQAGCRVYLFAAPVALANVGPNFYSGTLSGCDPVNAQFLAGPITSPLERTKIVFRCAPEEHGSIAVSFTIDGRPAPRTDGEEFPGGLLVLEPKSGPAIRCPVSEGDLGKQIVRGIPFGLYQARFVAQRSSFTFPSGEKPPLSLRVDKQVAQFDIALDATGGVDIEVRDEHGAAVSGPIAIDFGGPPTIYLEKTTISDVEVPPGTRVVPNSTMRRFAAAPYGVSGISAGKHFVMLREPFRADASGVDNSTIVVEAGKRTRVLFTPKPK